MMNVFTFKVIPGWDGVSEYLGEYLTVDAKYDLVNKSGAPIIQPGGKYRILGHLYKVPQERWRFLVNEYQLAPLFLVPYPECLENEIDEVSGWAYINNAGYSFDDHTGVEHLREINAKTWSMNADT